jgi:hypothetical protein
MHGPIQHTQLYLLIEIREIAVMIRTSYFLGAARLPENNYQLTERQALSLKIAVILGKLGDIDR